MSQIFVRWFVHLRCQLLVNCWYFCGLMIPNTKCFLSVAKLGILFKIEASDRLPIVSLATGWLLRLSQSYFDKSWQVHKLKLLSSGFSYGDPPSKMSDHYSAYQEMNKYSNAKNTAIFIVNVIVLWVAKKKCWLYAKVTGFAFLFWIIIWALSLVIYSRSYVNKTC